MFLDVIRYLAFGVVAFASLVAGGSWALRTRRINPFSRGGQLIRRSTDPLLRPIEHWIHRRGGNPQNAEAWLFGGALVGGIALVGVGTMVEGLIASFGAVIGRPNLMIRWFIVLAARLVAAAVLVRAVGSWFGIHRFSPYARPLFVLTDWIVEPLRRWVPPIGQVDVAPFVAFLLLQLVISLVA